MLIRLIIWTFGVVLSFLPLIFVALSAVAPSPGPTFLEAISNAELLAVAFTVGGIAAFDVLIISNAAQSGLPAQLRPLWIGLGALTLLLTITSIGIYLLLKFKVAHWTTEETAFTIQALCVGTVITSFLCESRQ